MSCIPFRHGQNGGVVCVSRTFKPGDKPPAGYLEVEDWWRVQRKAGLRQALCSCGKWIFPQEREDHKHGGR